MRARRPHLFSDSAIDRTLTLPRVTFEYHLESLTSRKQETAFEHFCRRIAEKELCPNLRLQTGPTGGGDSKVDAETYPVAPSIAERWWIGSPSAAEERWGFAFSAKKRWKQKVKDDVASITSTGRSYARIYFITNQFVRDKDRAEEEDALSAVAGVPVHILDRSWLVEKVYANGHLEMAIDALGIVGAHADAVQRLGPLDAARLAELEQLDRHVTDPDRYAGAHYQLAQDCARSAILARGLGRPRSEVDARFLQAERFAREVDITAQRLRITYKRAWTAHWWYEDYAEFNRLYDEVESHARVANEVADVHLLQNLWMLLHPAVASNRLTAAAADIEGRRGRLVGMLRAIAGDASRPNSVLEARADLALIDLTTAAQAGQAAQIEAVWPELSSVLDAATDLPSFPLEGLFDVLSELGAAIDSEPFDALYEKLAELVRKRRSDGEAGEAYCNRAFQKLRLGKPYDAIRWFGRAEELVYTDEYQGELVKTLLGSSLALDRVGLPWAARNKALAAAERTLAVFHREGRIIGPALVTLQQLVWTELRLGRVPHVLGAMNLAAAIASALKLEGERANGYEREREDQERVLGIHFLRLPADRLPSVSRLPDGLERIGMPTAAMALLYSLAQATALRDAGYCPPDHTDESIASTFEAWRDQPAAGEIALQPNLLESGATEFCSTILGCRLVFEVPTGPVPVAVAESVLGALEAFIATSDERDLTPHREELRVTVTVSADVPGAELMRFHDGPAPRIEVSDAADGSSRTADDVRKYMDVLRDVIIHLICRATIVHDAQAWSARVAGEERAFSRALALGDTLTLNRNIFGAKPLIRVQDYIPADAREVVPAATTQKPSHPPVTAAKEMKFGWGEPPSELTDTERRKHTDRRVLSPIDIETWNRARWRAAVFLSNAHGGEPGLALAFEDAVAARAIFEAWLRRWGSEGSDATLRLAIITGITTANPAAYAVSVGPHISTAAGEEGKTFVMVSRIQRMDASTPLNLQRFLDAYAKAGAYDLAPAHLRGPSVPPQPFFDLALRRRQLTVRPAWQIDEHDPDMSALDPDDEPVVPQGVTDAPVLRALAQVRAMRGQRKRQP